jgi:nicotinic acid mononucleotide adenylyltransferase
VIPRPGFGLDPQVLATLRDRGTQIELAQFQGPDISSTQARKEQEDGSFCADLPAVVRTYIEAQGLYRQKV